MNFLIFKILKFLSYQIFIKNNGMFSFSEFGTSIKSSTHNTSHYWAQASERGGSGRIQVAVGTSDAPLNGFADLCCK